MRKQRRFFSDASAATAVLFALSLLPIFIFSAVAIDYSFLVRTKSNLQNDLDAAVLAATSYASNRIAQNKPPTQAQVTADLKLEIGTRVAGYRPATVLSNETVVKYSYVNNVMSLTATVHATMNSLMGRILGFEKYTFEASSSATKNSATYANISLVLDVSPSMAIGATTNDITALQNVTTPSCAFACHDAEGAPKSNYDIARDNKVTLRIDVVKSAAQQLASFMSSAQQSFGQYSMGLYTMGSTLTTILAPTTNLSAISAAVNNVDFDRMSVVFPTLPAPAASNIASGPSVALTRYADTDFSTTLPALNKIVANPGNGSRPSTPLQYVFLVTDGLSDTGVPYNYGVKANYDYDSPPIPNFSNGNADGKLTAPITSSLCDSFKNRGIQVAVLYVTYVADPTDPSTNYQTLVETNAPSADLVNNLTYCASPGLFYQASDAASISTGLLSLFRSVMLTSRLTQ